jgi:hypothetical protein
VLLAILALLTGGNPGRCDTVEYSIAIARAVSDGVKLQVVVRNRGDRRIAFVRRGLTAGLNVQRRERGRWSDVRAEERLLGWDGDPARHYFEELFVQLGPGESFAAERLLDRASLAGLEEETAGAGTYRVWLEYADYGKQQSDWLARVPDDLRRNVLTGCSLKSNSVEFALPK